MASCTASVRSDITVSYVYGDELLTSVNLQSGKKTEPPADPNMQGYAFDGWYLNPGLTETFNFQKAINRDTTIYAKFTPNVYLISLDYQGATDGNVVFEQSVTYDSNYTLPIPIRENHVFLGWFGDETGEQHKYTDSSGSSINVWTELENKTLFAHWKETDRLAVNFETGGGTHINSQYLLNGDKAIKPVNPTKSGYTFENWYTESSFINVYDFEKPVISDVTLYAKWTENIVYYSVTFNSNGGSTISSQSVSNGGKVVKPVNPTKSGYTFENWYTESALQNTYDFEKSVTSDITLYAKWTEIIVYYTVTFNSNGGTAVENQNIPSGGKVVKPVNPTKSGYAFENWYTEPALQNAYDFNKTVISDVTLYAKWTEIIVYYTVTFNSNGGSTISSQNVPGGGKAIKPVSPTKSGYTFENWYTESSFLNVYDFDRPVISEVTLYAKWTENVIYYSVTFNSNGGTAVENQNIPSGGKVIKPANPTKTGYTFENWYTESSLLSVYDFEKVVTSDITLYAKWTTDGGSAGTAGLQYARDAYGGYMVSVGSATNVAQIVIPSTYNFASVTSIAASGFSGLASIQSVVIPDSILHVGDSAFNNCVNLKTVSFGRGVRTIGQFAFCNTALTAVELFDNLQSIGYSAFYYCRLLTAISFGSGVSLIGANAFEDCVLLTTVHIPESVQKIESYAFAKCSALATIFIHRTNENQITELGEKVFPLTALSEIYVPEKSFNDYYYSQVWSEYKAYIKAYNYPKPAIAVSDKNACVAEPSALFTLLYCPVKKCSFYGVVRIFTAI